MIQKIALVGPESTGKSTLAVALADHFGTKYVPEYARFFINQLNRPYNEADLVTIAHGQLEAEKAAISGARKFLFCDTNLLVIKVWSQVKYGRISTDITQKMALDSYSLHLLPAPDIPWEADPQREHPAFREQLFEIYRQELEKAQVPFHILQGEHRLKEAIRHCSNLLIL